MGVGEIKPKRHMNQQMWCLIIETCDSIYNIVFLTNDILAFFNLMNTLQLVFYFILFRLFSCLGKLTF